MQSRLWLFFKTAGKLGWGGLLIAVALFSVSFLEHVTNHNLAAYFLVVIAALAFAFGAYCAWDVEHQRLLAETKSHMEDNCNRETSAVNLQATVHHLQTSLDSRSAELERVITANRPEIFSSYSNALLFEEIPPNGWDIESTFVCRSAIKIENTTKATAIDVCLESIDCDYFSICFSPIPKMLQGQTEMVDARATFYELECDGDTWQQVYQPDGVGNFLYSGDENDSKKTAKIEQGMNLKVTWKDSSGNCFFSTTRNGIHSAIQRMECPMTDEEKRIALSEDEVYG